MNLTNSELLFLKFELIYAAKFGKYYEDRKDLRPLALAEWEVILKNYSQQNILDAVHIAKMEFDWPPSISEFLKILDRVMGIPNVDEAFRLASLKQYTHPVIVATVRKIGSYAMSNETEKKLRSKFKQYYQESVKEFRSSRILGIEHIP